MSPARAPSRVTIRPVGTRPNAVTEIIIRSGDRPMSPPINSTP
jgi:hypothetical protein